MANFQIENTPLWLDVKKIISTSKKGIHYEYRGLLHTENEDIPVLKIMVIDTIRDYINKIGDYVHIEFKMPLGEYINKLYPYRTNLEFSIKKIELKETAPVMNSEIPILVDRYKAVFLYDENPQVASTSLIGYDSESLNKLDMVDVKLQLLDRGLEPMRIKTVSGVYRQINHEKLIGALISGESNKILVDGKPIVEGIDVVKPDNEKDIQHVVIPDGTLISQIPEFLQKHMGGIYSAGIANYYQKYNGKKIWFVYPLYDLNRFDKNVCRVMFYAIPESRLSGIDRTYIQEGNLIRVLATAQKKYKDSADADYMNHGSGFRMADANAYLKKPVEITKDGPLARRANLNYEVMAFERQDGLNYAPITDSKISNNPFKEYSKVLARNVARIDLVWENANPELIHPGMPCKYLYYNKEKLIELKGTIVHVHAFNALQGKGISGNSYRTMCYLTLLTEKSIETPEEIIPQSKGEF